MKFLILSLLFIVPAMLHAQQIPQYLINTSFYRSDSESIELMPTGAQKEVDGFVLSRAVEVRSPGASLRFEEGDFTAETEGAIRSQGRKLSFLSSNEEVELEVLNGPRIVTLGGEAASFEFTSGAVHYFEEADEDKWKLKESDEREQLVFDIIVEGTRGDQIEIRELVVEAVMIADRKPVRTTDIPAGKPDFESVRCRMTDVRVEPEATYFLILPKRGAAGTHVIGFSLEEVKEEAS